MSDPGLSESQRKQRIGSLIAAAESANPAFGKELRGMVSLADASAALRNNNNAAAVSLSTDALGLFNEAVAAGDQSADLQMAKADAELIRGDSAAYEQVMWKVLSDRPDRDSAYTELFSYYQQNNRAERAVAVSQSWLLADPTNIGAQLLHIALLNRAGVKDEATKAITDMYAQHPDDAQVIDMARQVLAANGSNAFDQLLETRVASHPGDLPAVQELVNDYVQQKRTGEAVHLIDNARTAVAKDADQLYFVAHLYEQTSPPGDLAATEQTLSMAIKVDPNNAGASNDLGYEWADSGKNLTDAEGLIRKAIQLEPDNGAYLDSLGWVLYKQGRFGESRQYLEQAVLPDSEADPIVLDHLGDALYRLNQTTDAQKRWLESQSKLEERLNQRQQANLPPPAANDELTPLRLKLQAKLRQVQGGQPADVAPVSESSLKQANASE